MMHFLYETVLCDWYGSVLCCYVCSLVIIMSGVWCVEYLKKVTFVLIVLHYALCILISMIELLKRDLYLLISKARFTLAELTGLDRIVVAGQFVVCVERLRAG